MPGATELLVAATSSNALVTSSDSLVASSFVFLVVMPGATRWRGWIH